MSCFAAGLLESGVKTQEVQSTAFQSCFGEKLAGLLGLLASKTDTAQRMAVREPVAVDATCSVKDTVSQSAVEENTASVMVMGPGEPKAARPASPMPLLDAASAVAVLTASTAVR